MVLPSRQVSFPTSVCLRRQHSHTGQSEDIPPQICLKYHFLLLLSFQNHFKIIEIDSQLQVTGVFLNNSAMPGYKSSKIISKELQALNSHLAAILFECNTSFPYKLNITKKARPLFETGPHAIILVRV